MLKNFPQNFVFMINVAILLNLKVFKLIFKNVNLYLELIITVPPYSSISAYKYRVGPLRYLDQYMYFIILRWFRMLNYLTGRYFATMYFYVPSVLHSVVSKVY